MSNRVIRIGQPRIGRAGLGNELLPWARCIVWCRDNAALEGPYAWRRLHVGPYLRREQDKRQYHREVRSNLTPWLRFSVSQRMLSGPHVLEGDQAPIGSFVRVFEGLGNYFHDIRGESEYIGMRLRGMAKVPLECTKRPSTIAVHVRRGDFAPPSAAEVGRSNTATPIAWYESAIEAILDAVPNVAIEIYTDQPQHPDVQTLLAGPNVELARPGTALQHMFAMATAGALITSNSTFSGWGAYLGRLPALWASSNDRYWRGDGADFSTTDADGLPRFVECIARSRRESGI